MIEKSEKTKINSQRIGILSYNYKMTLSSLTFTEAESSILAEADGAVDEMRTEAGVQGGGWPLARVVTQDVFARRSQTGWTST